MAKHSIAIAFATMTILAAASVIAQDLADRKDPGKMTIAEIMVETNKKPYQLLRSVADGKATVYDKDRLVKLYKSMAAQQPPKGDLDDWKERTALLIDAAEKAQKGAPDAKKLLTKAANCTACHKEHKED